MMLNEHKKYFVSENAYARYGSYVFTFDVGSGVDIFLPKATIEFDPPTVDDYYDDDYSESLFIDVEYDTRGQPHYHMDDTFFGQDQLILGESLGYVSTFNELLASEYWL